MQIITTGSPDIVNCRLEGSFDGINWVTLGSTTDPSSYTFSVQFPALCVRANLISLSGGSSPTVTAIVGAKG